MKIRVRLNSYIVLSVIAFCSLLIIGRFFLKTSYISSYYLYIGYIVLSTFIMLISENTRPCGKKEFLFWVAIVLAALIMAFRAQSGLDDLTYLRIFHEENGSSLFKYVSAHNSIEIGYIVCNYVIFNLFDGNYNAFQIIITLLSFLIWGYGIKLYRNVASETTMLLLLWTQYYFLIMGAGLIRIFIAVGFALIAMYYVVEKNIKRYLLYIFIASLFHISSLILLILLVFFINKEWAKKRWKRIAIVLVAVIPVGMIFAARIIAPYLGERYSRYLTIGSFSVSLSSLDVLPLLLICLYCMKDISEDSRKYYVFGLCLMCASIGVSVFTSVIGMGRIVYYTNLGILLDIAILFKTRFTSRIRGIMPVVLLSYAAVYLIHAGLNQVHHMDALFPYQTIFVH